jgi:hypothetical protein
MSQLVAILCDIDDFCKSFARHEVASITRLNPNTGREDHHGTEVYEADIVHWYDH